MVEDPYLQAVAILVEKGFKLKGEIWEDLPWSGDMPEDFVLAFSMIYKKFENERIQRFTGI